jgi:hypothetical protein
MKYKAIILIISLLYITPVFAQEQDLQILQTREEIREKILFKNSELQEKIELKRIEIKQKIEAISEEQKIKTNILIQERVLKIIIQVFEQLEAMIVKFDGIVIRIENRIAKLDAEDIDTSNTKELLIESKTKIEEATVLIAATKLELESRISTEISKEEIKASIELCKNILEETRLSLIKVVRSLKLLGEFSTDSILIEA